MGADWLVVIIVIQKQYSDWSQHLIAEGKCTGEIGKVLCYGICKNDVVKAVVFWIGGELLNRATFKVRGQFSKLGVNVRLIKKRIDSGDLVSSEFQK